MCGICGFVGRDGIGPSDVAAVERMAGAMVHRGPDGAGAYNDGSIAMAMRRLSIIDLDGGSQPLYSEDRSIVVIANGEIYNYVELRRSLAARGHHFASGSDCEVISHLYEDGGLDGMTSMRGMFAFALWDKRKCRLVLGRDRMGEKPLYVFSSSRGILFASEMKALLSSGVVPFDLNLEAIDSYLYHMYVPEPATAVSGVVKLSAASWMTVDTDPWKVVPRRYWDMEDAPEIRGDPRDVLGRILEEVGEITIRADVPVGVALSGGLDSSLVAALVNRKYKGKVVAFTAGYEGPCETDERADARELARHLDIPLHEVEIRDEDAASGFTALNSMRDDPIADPAGYAYYAVMKLAREHGVPVILQGQGGDELFWGYGWLRRAVGLSRIRRALSEGRFPPLRDLVREFRLQGPAGWKPWQIRLWLSGYAGGASSVARISAALKAPRDRLALIDTVDGFNETKRLTQELYGPAMLDAVRETDVTDMCRVGSEWPREDIRTTRLICETYLRCNGVAQGDRLSMASSVEMRLPYLDYRFVEAVIGLRKARPDVELEPKAWLRSVACDYLPAWVLARKKRGFTPPVARWDRAVVDCHFDDLLDGNLVESGIVRREGVRSIRDEPVGLQGAIPMLHRLLVLESWTCAMKKCACRRG